MLLDAFRGQVVCERPCKIHVPLDEKMPCLKRLCLFATACSWFFAPALADTVTLKLDGLAQYTGTFVGINSMPKPCSAAYPDIAAYSYTHWISDPLHASRRGAGCLPRNFSIP